MKTIYIDATVAHGKFEDEFSYWTNRFFEKCYSTGKVLYVSDVTEVDLIDAPAKVREAISAIPGKNLEKAPLNEEAIRLAEKYKNDDIVGTTEKTNCLHIAIATILKTDLYVSWNYKDLLNLEMIHGFNAVNLRNGYRQLEIRNPREVFNYADER